MIDNSAFHPIIEEEIFIIDTSNDDFLPIGYIVFIRQPQLSLV